MAGNERIKFLRGTKAKRQASTANLSAGQPFYETDTNTLYVGNGGLLKDTVSLSATILNAVYPVGSIYMSVSSTSPETLFGGSWQRWGQGRTVISVDDNEFDTAELTGGSDTVSVPVPKHKHTLGAHSHTIEQHTHGITIDVKSGGAHTHDDTFTATAANSGNHTHTLYNYVKYDSNFNVASGDVPFPDVQKVSTYTTSIDGSHTHTITIEGSVSECGGHTHTAVGTIASSGELQTESATGSCSYAGEDAVIDTRSSYITCYMWKRVA